MLAARLRSAFSEGQLQTVESKSILLQSGKQPRAQSCSGCVLRQTFAPCSWALQEFLVVSQSAGINSIVCKCEAPFAQFSSGGCLVLRETSFVKARWKRSAPNRRILHARYKLSPAEAMARTQARAFASCNQPKHAVCAAAGDGSAFCSTCVAPRPDNICISQSG